MWLHNSVAGSFTLFISFFYTASTFSIQYLLMTGKKKRGKIQIKRTNEKPKKKKEREQEKDKIEGESAGDISIIYSWLATRVCVCVKILLVCSIVCFGHSFVRFVILEHFSFLKTSAVTLLSVTVSICLFMADPFFFRVLRPIGYSLQFSFS